MAVVELCLSVAERNLDDIAADERVIRFVDRECEAAAALGGVVRDVDEERTLIAAFAVRNDDPAERQCADLVGQVRFFGCGAGCENLFTDRSDVGFGGRRTDRLLHGAAAGVGGSLTAEGRNDDRARAGFRIGFHRNVQGCGTFAAFAVRDVE